MVDKKYETVKLKDDKGVEKKVRFRKGALHRQLGVPEDEDLPRGIMQKIKNSKIGDFITVRKKKIKVTELLKKRAVLGINLSKGSRK